MVIFVVSGSHLLPEKFG